MLDLIGEMQAEGLGETEVHLHHGVDAPDTAENLRRTLVDFRDTLAERHGMLSRVNGTGDPMYAFVHGNLALANSSGGRFCGVDNELEILRDTGCYADMTLPSAPERSQVPMINQIYECGLPLNEPVLIEPAAVREPMGQGRASRLSSRGRSSSTGHGRSKGFRYPVSMMVL